MPPVVHVAVLSKSFLFRSTPYYQNLTVSFSPIYVSYVGAIVLGEFVVLSIIYYYAFGYKVRAVFLMWFKLVGGTCLMVACRYYCMMSSQMIVVHYNTELSTDA